MHLSIAVDGNFSCILAGLRLYIYIYMCVCELFRHYANWDQYNSRDMEHFVNIYTHKRIVLLIEMPNKHHGI